MMAGVPNDRAVWRAAMLWIALWTILRLAYGALLPLTPDETNYWQWGRHLAWGYHDQAPLIGWAIGASTRLFGHTEFAVRLPTAVAVAVASLYLVAFARRWFGAPLALAVAMLSQGAFLINAGGILSTADGVQAAGWAAAAYHTARAFEAHTWRQWLAAGCWLGFGLLSKFTVVLFPIAVLGYALSSPAHRGRLGSLKPWSALLVAVALFAPVLWWNAHHDWSTFRHIAGLGGVGRATPWQGKWIGEFVSGQLAVLSPVVAVAVAVAWWRAWRVRHEPAAWPVRFGWWLSFPPVALFTVQAVRSRVYDNWPAMGYLTAIILAAVFVGQVHRRFWRWTVGTALAHTVLALGLVLLQTTPHALPVPAQWDVAARELSGWRELGQRAATLRAELPEADRAFLFATRYQVASELAFYTPGQPATVSINRWGRPNVYDYWWRDEDLIGRNALGVTTGASALTHQLAEVFARVDPPERLAIYRRPTDSQPIRIFYLYRCYGFTGGLRPPVSR